MTKNQKVQKLANAITAYRGLYRVGPHGQQLWIHPPQWSKEPAIAVWLERLQLPLTDSLDRIRNFKTRTEFHNWLNTI